MTARAIRTALGLLLCAAGADAQVPPSEPVTGLVELAVGGGVLGGAALAAVDAELRANSRQPEPFRLFASDTRVGRAPVLELRVGTPLGRRVAFEARLARSRPELRVSVSGDLEGAPALVAVERIDQYVIDGSVLVMLAGRDGGRFIPFAAAGAGYLRQLHEDRALAEKGRTYHAGAGMRYVLRARGRGAAPGVGFRGDVRIHLFTGGVAPPENGRRWQPLLSGSAFATF